jgi:hypothetical protein
MKFGLHSVNLHTCGYPETAARLARTAEAAGFESLWVADHVVLPDPPIPQRPMAPDIWYGFGLDVEQTARDIEALREMEQRYQRPTELGRLEVSVTPLGYDIDSATVERYATIGVDRLILCPQPVLAEADVEPFIATTAQALKIT